MSGEDDEQCRLDRVEDEYGCLHNDFYTRVFDPANQTEATCPRRTLSNTDSHELYKIVAISKCACGYETRVCRCNLLVVFDYCGFNKACKSLNIGLHMLDDSPHT